MLSTTSAQTVLSSSENEKLFLNEKVVESPSQPKTLTAKSPSSVLGYIAREVDITCRLLRSNAVGFLFIFLGASVSRIIRHPLSWSENVLAVIESFVLTIPGAYVFDICNQTSSPEEDYVNKPDRPIPASLLTIGQAKTRWALSWILTPLALWEYAGPWAMFHLWTWELLITFCYVWPRWFSWFMRNFFAAYSYCILGRLLNQVYIRYAADDWDISWMIDYTIFAWFMGTIHVQEFYDLEGDRNADRETLPMLLSPRGLVYLRVGTSAFLVAFSTGLAYWSYLKMDQDMMIGPMAALQLILSTYLAYRVVALEGYKEDRATYHHYYYPPVFAILFTLVLVTK